MLSPAEAAAWNEIVEHLEAERGIVKRCFLRLVDALIGCLTAILGGYSADGAIPSIGVFEAVRVLDARTAL